MLKNFQARNNKNILSFTVFALLSVSQNDTSLAPITYYLPGA